MIEDVFFQVRMDGVTYVTKEKRALSEKRVLKSASRPPMSFDYEILTYSADEKTVYLNYSKRDLTEKEIEEVETYILSIQENKEASLMMLVNMQAKEILNTSDWYVIRFLETGVPVPEEIAILRATAREEIVTVV